jgi:hypothetical protein
MEKKKDTIDFLRDNSEYFGSITDILKPHESYMLAYNTLKYYIILLRKFKDKLEQLSLASSMGQISE